ncbi:restriction endonuclease subunit S, partial [Bifidobacterium adolescentis]|nr:restriction endonuclease subunit S [Bifidobacterium adolescentis]MDB1488404.1 restriction endonuclease subunit S [Bifidobacterium adolescentis]MDB1491864.1 restriction endonuclease subunit S [Bifidobacterium adolescentis]
MAEQHGKTLVPQIRFAGFTDPWEQRKLGEVATFGGGHTPSMSDSDNYEGGNVLWVTSQDVKSHYLDGTTTQITEKGAKELTLYPAGSLVMVTRSGILRHTLPVAELRKPSTVNQDIRVILPQENYYGQWLLQFFISRNKELLLEFGKTGTTVESVDFSKMRDMVLLTPSLPEQQQIGRYFARLDNLITLHQRKYDKLCVLKKSMLDKMFPKGGSLYPEIRFAGFTDPWEQRKLGEVATFGGGHTPSMSDSDNYEGGNVLWVTSQDVKSHYLDGTTTQITEKGAKELTLYPAGSLVMVTRSGILRHTLPVAELRKPSTVNQDIRVILPQENYYGQWLLQFFISRNKELLLEFGKTGTTVESVDFSKMRDMVLLTPSLPEQQQIGRYFARLDNLITLHQRKLELLRNIKKSMLDKMFV